MLARDPDQCRYGSRVHQRRRSAAEEDRRELPFGKQSRLVGEVRKQCLAPCIVVDAIADMAVEVAIGAFADAERPVDVERKRFAAHSFSAATSLRKASARWLISCFSWGSNSP